MKKLKNPQADIIKFWDTSEVKIKQWYLKQQKDDDVVISASPTFLLKEICERLEIRYLIASDVDINNGRFVGKNCYGIEKVKRFKQIFKEGPIQQFYSDSCSDMPLAKMANEAFLVKGDRIVIWEITQIKEG